MKLTMIFSFLLASLFSCQPKQQREAYTSLAVDEFAALLARPDVQRVDVRTVAEYSEGHIPGSLNINVLDEASFLRVARSTLQTAHPVALYCRSGKRSKRAAQLLARQGYRVYELREGFAAWRASGGEVVR